jgi:hypothetical protein
MKTNTGRFFLFMLLSLCSCGGLHFNQTAYDADVRIERKTQALLLKAGESYTIHAQKVDSLKNDIAVIRFYESSRKMNKATIAMWKEVTNPDMKGSLYNLLELLEDAG